ncbi:AcrR family transcriptional regulator [Bradyrhizobium sp. USDA 4532]|nr:AcrR family transcriptional regulator [Bradyrhizobium sp. USDA 4545]MCP1850967.1 AcrR family transcriptional regulator [Bradyrhizobium sp. USDA 4541]MCP1914851.1 AcrR family transcriptional regulator [Bradyrhizobium elkanii]MCP1916870.1 AcrR family transcriptional regulator [Bradyrhizobium sp. USDA 4532]
MTKATVVDVARALDVSHGSVYRHFPSKASLRDAVAKRWLDRANEPLCKIAAGEGPAPERLEQWLRTAFTIKQKKVCDDPEMFATYLALAQDAREVVEAYKDKQVDLIAKILSDGVAQGVFEIDNVKATARAVFDATVRYHHPAHAEEWAKPECPGRIDALLALLLKGLRVCKP